MTCPTCGSTGVYFDKTRQGWICKTKHPKRKFSLKTGTIKRRKTEEEAAGVDRLVRQRLEIGKKPTR